MKARVVLSFFLSTPRFCCGFCLRYFCILSPLLSEPALTSTGFPPTRLTQKRTPSHY